MNLASCSEASSGGRIRGLPNRRHFLTRCGLGLAGLPLAVPQVWAAGRKQPPLIQYLVRLGYHAFELERDRHDHYLVAGELEEQRVTFLVDTGCSVSAVDRRLLKGARTLGELGIAIQDSLLGRIDRESIYLGKRLALGKAEFFNQPWFLSKREVQQARAAGQPLVELDGLLGVDHLFAFGALIDCRRRRLWVSRERMAK